MLIVQSASDPVYANAENSDINLQVKFSQFNEVLPFTATPNDPMPYGVDLYNRAVAGEFGPIAPYEPPVTEAQPVTTGSQTL